VALACVLDDIIGLDNPIGFREILANAVWRARRHNEFLTLCLIYLHHTASPGPADGHEPHRRLCHALACGLRRSDILAPLNDDTLALLLPRTAARPAGVVCKRLRKIIASHYDREPGMPTDVQMAVSHLDDPKVRSGGDLLQAALQKLAVRVHPPIDGATPRESQIF
jgi:GGDEF domain-containing protein